MLSGENAPHTDLTYIEQGGNRLRWKRDDRLSEIRPLVQVEFVSLESGFFGGLLVAT